MEKEILMGTIFLRLHKNQRDEECATGSNTHRHVYACWTMFYLNSSHLDTNPQSPTLCKTQQSAVNCIKRTVSSDILKNHPSLSHKHALKLP